MMQALLAKEVVENASLYQDQACYTLRFERRATLAGPRIHPAFNVAGAFSAESLF